MPDIVHFIQTAPLIDLFLLVLLFAAFVMGYMEGPVRRVIGMAVTLVAFVLAANLREPVGKFLTGYWTQFPPEYNHLLAFAISFSVLLVAVSVLIQARYKRVDVFPRHQVLEEITGGVVGVLEALLMITIAIVIFSSYTIPSEEFKGELDYIRQIQDALIHTSNIAAALRDVVVPPFITATSAFLPADLSRLFN